MNPPKKVYDAVFLPEIDGKLPSLEEPIIATDILDATQMESILDFLPKSISDAALLIPDELKYLGEDELKRVCYPHEGSRDKKYRNISTSFSLDQKIRLSLWNEFELARQRNTKLSVAQAIKGLAHRDHFYQKIIQNPHRLAWILTPPAEYALIVEDLLHRGVRRLYEIIELPLKSKTCRCHYFCVCNKNMPKRQVDGEKVPARACACKPRCICPAQYNTKSAEVILKAFERIELRAKGSITQVISQTTKSLNVNVSQTIPAEGSSAIAPQDIDRELLKLRAQMNALTGNIQTANQNLERLPSSQQPEVLSPEMESE